MGRACRQVTILFFTILPFLTSVTEANTNRYQQELDWLSAASENIKINIPDDNPVLAAPKTAEFVTDSISTGQAGLQKRSASRTPTDEEVANEIDQALKARRGAKQMRYRSR